MIHNKFRILLLLLLVVALGAQGSAQEGYRIEITVEGIADTNLILGFHMGDRQFIHDSVRVDSRGHGVFEGEERLEEGMYLVILPGNTYIEMIVDRNQHFSLTTRMDELVLAARFGNSPDNTAFYEYLDFIQATSRKAANVRQQLAGDDLDEGRRHELNEQMQGFDQQVAERQDQYMEDFPDGLFSKILLAQRNPDMSDLAEQLAEHNDPDFQYYAYRSRFWDHVDFTDQRILRTPVYHSMLSRYVNQFLVQVPDTIIREADRLLEKARANREIFRYTLWYLTNNAERSQLMGMDAVFVHLAENYYNTGEAFWMTEEGLERIRSRAERLAPLLIGRVAPDIAGFKAGGESISLHDVEADYLVVYFWESDCAHCQAQTPVLKEVYDKYHEQGLNVYALNTETSHEKWGNAVSNYGLNWINVNDVSNRSGYREKYDIYAIPTIFILDSEKRIIAKRIGAEQIDGFMQFELNRRSRDGATGR